jgi:hypothetical protein
MWGYVRINDTWLECDRCGSVVRDTDKHSLFHTNFVGDDTPLFELELPVRIDNALRSYGITTVEGLINDVLGEPGSYKRERDGDSVIEYFFDLRNVGFKTAEKALGVLQTRGIVDTSGKIIKD